MPEASNAVRKKSIKPSPTSARSHILSIFKNEQFGDFKWIHTFANKINSKQMANTYKKIYLHIVFAVKNRNALLGDEWRQRLFSYIHGIINKRGHFALAVNGHVDHLHILFDYSMEELIPDLVREIKKAATQFIKEEELCQYRFEWQAGYGVFSVGWKEKSKVIEYIQNQETHHEKQRPFREEYLSLLEKYEIEFKNEYVFDFLK
jgi:REP element-mobilizing transposase RayT